MYTNLVQVNSEARCEALRFYCVQIPCPFEDAGGKVKEKAVLYLNPEYELLHLILAGLAMHWRIKLLCPNSTCVCMLR